MNKPMIHNPVLKGFNPDPSICRVGDDYYIATSTFEWFPGVSIHHSRDLVNWRLVGYPLTRVSQLDMRGNPDSGGVWAPALSYHNGQFWLIYSNVRGLAGPAKDLDNYLVTADNIEGPWSEPIFLNGSGFDPSLFHDDDGRQWLLNMVWDPRKYNHAFYGIVLQAYSHELQKLMGTPKLIFKGTELALTEAPHLYKVDGYYYLITAEGGTKYEHAVTVARSRTIDGPYEVHPENPILTSWPYLQHPLQKSGHASLVQTQQGEWYLAHLMGRPLVIPGSVPLQDRGYCPLGRETSIQKVEWREGWPYVVGGPGPSVQVQAPDLPPHPWPVDHRELNHFDEPALEKHFNTLRIPFDEQLGSLTDRPGYLRLYGRDSQFSLFYSALVARRWQSFNFLAETKMAFEPHSFQQQAGLICYYNTRNWASAYVTWDEALGRCLTLAVAERGTTTHPLGKAGQIPVPDTAEHVWFLVTVSPTGYHFSYSFDGDDFTAIPVQLASHKLSDDYVNELGFFTGAFVGMHCIDTTGQRLPADFDYFRYSETS